MEKLCSKNGYLEFWSWFLPLSSRDFVGDDSINCFQGGKIYIYIFALLNYSQNSSIKCLHLKGNRSTVFYTSIKLIILCMSAQTCTQKPTHNITL